MPSRPPSSASPAPEPSRSCSCAYNLRRRPVLPAPLPAACAAYSPCCHIFCSPSFVHVQAATHPRPHAMEVGESLRTSPFAAGRMQRDAGQTKEELDVSGVGSMRRSLHAWSRGPQKLTNSSSVGYPQQKKVFYFKNSIAKLYIYLRFYISCWSCSYIICINQT